MQGVGLVIGLFAANVPCPFGRAARSRCRREPRAGCCAAAARRDRTTNQASSQSTRDSGAEHGREYDRLCFAFALVPLVACAGTSAPPADASSVGDEGSRTLDAELRASLAGSQRTEAERARDVYRHPRETLEFFGLRDDMTVIELSPGEGWYTAVLAPVLAERGKPSSRRSRPRGSSSLAGPRSMPTSRTPRTTRAACGRSPRRTRSGVWTGRSTLRLARATG